MIPLLLLMGLGTGAFAWGLARQKRALKTEALAKPLALAPNTFPWEKKEPEIKLDENLLPNIERAVRYAQKNEASPVSLIRFADSLAPDFPRANALLLETAKTIQEREAQRQTGETRLVGGDDGRRYSTFFVPKGLIPMPKLEWAGEGGGGYALETEKEWEEARERGWKAVDGSRVPVTPEHIDILKKNLLHNRSVWKVYDKKTKDGRTLYKALEGEYRAAEDEKNKELEGCGGFFGCLFSFLGDVLKTFAKVYFSGTRLVAPMLANIPVIGTAIAAVATFASELALGERIDKAFLSSARAALPGQPLSGMAFDAGVKFISGIASGDRWDSILLGAGRDLAMKQLADKIPIKGDYLVEQGVPRFVPWPVRDIGGKLQVQIPEVVQQGFDAAMAMRQAQALQEAGFDFFRNLAKGQTNEEKTGDFIEKLRRAEKGEGKLEDLLVKDVRERLQAEVQGTVLGRDPELVAGETRKRLEPVLRAMEDDPAYPRLFLMKPDELARELRISPTLAWAALSTVRYLPIEPWLRKKLEDKGVIDRGAKFPFVESYISEEIFRPPPMPERLRASTMARMDRVLGDDKLVIWRRARDIAEREASKPPSLRSAVLVVDGKVVHPDLAIQKVAKAMLDVMDGRKIRERDEWVRHYNDLEERRSA